MSTNLDLAKKGYEYFQKGDIPGLIGDLVDDDCILISPGPKAKLPWAGQFKGKQAVADFFKRVAENMHFSELTPREMIEQGDTVVVLGSSSAEIIATGKSVKDGSLAQTERCCMDQGYGRRFPKPVRGQIMRTEFLRPRSNIRLRVWTATSTSVASRLLVREHRLSHRSPA